MTQKNNQIIVSIYHTSTSSFYGKSYYSGAFQQEQQQLTLGPVGSSR